jgi:hypothetical protein
MNHLTKFAVKTISEEAVEGMGRTKNNSKMLLQVTEF